eukprot:scaffold21973_cov54-Cyclotella_meneghiniana.AAC.1
MPDMLYRIHGTRLRAPPRVINFVRRLVDVASSSPTFSVDSEISDGPSASVGDFGFNGLAHSEETSVSMFSSIDPQEEAINNETAESTKSRARYIHKSASGDDSSSRGGGFSDGQEGGSSVDDDVEESSNDLPRNQEDGSSDDDDDEEVPSNVLQRNQEDDPSDDDEDEEDSPIDLEDSRRDDEQFTQHETVYHSVLTGRSILQGSGVRVTNKRFVRFDDT